MTKTKSTKRALLLSALSLLMCVSMLIGSTFAWFTDSVTSKGNKIVAGTLDVQLWLADSNGNYNDISESTAPIFGNADSLAAQNNNADTLWEPGKTQVAYLKIVNNGNLALKYSVGLDVKNATKDLNEVMQYVITPDAKSGDVKTWAGNGKSVVLGTQLVLDSDVIMQPGDEHYFALSIHMDEAAGNEYQDASIEFDMTVLATQAMVEEDSFGKDYDENAQYMMPVSTAAQLQDALSAGKNVKLMNDIDLTNVAWTPAGATIDTAYSGVIDGQGHKIIGLSNANNQGTAFGLIAYGTDNVTVKNVVFENVNINGAGEYAAAVMGLYIADESTDAATYSVNFENITVSGAINASDKAAAILGCNYRSSYPAKNKNITFTFDNCVNNAAISGASRNGGIAGAVSGEFTADGNNSEIAVVFNNCVNNGSVASTSATYKTGAIVGFASGTSNYEFNNCVNNGTADGDLLGRLHVNMTAWRAVPSGAETFMYLDFEPQDLTFYDIGNKNYQVAVTYRWDVANSATNHYDTGNYYVGTMLADDEWRVTIDGVHYRLPANVPVDGVNDAGVVEDTAHINNPADIPAHWTGSDYELVVNGSESNNVVHYEYHKQTAGK